MRFRYYGWDAGKPAQVPQNTYTKGIRLLSARKERREAKSDSK